MRTELKQGDVWQWETFRFVLIQEYTPGHWVMFNGRGEKRHWDGADVLANWEYVGEIELSLLGELDV